jgi:hypothetical protein
MEISRTHLESKVDPTAMKSKALNRSMHAAKATKQDEFYTQLSDIEKELKHYAPHFKGKTVLCNCDDPRVSNFFHYFSYNFGKLKLKKLITTCYKNQQPDLFTKNESEAGIYLEYSGEKNHNPVPDPAEIGIHELKGDGDFRSAECIELLKEADIVVTNPPFSLFREYLAQLTALKKKFLVIANLNAITYKEVFSLIKENKIWLGYTHPVNFIVPDYYELREVRSWRDENGVNWRSFGNACWFTNLDIAKRHEDLILYKTYEPNTYPRYDNYDAIEVSKFADIPSDFDGAMGVPVTFLDKYNPDQFEILGITDRGNVWGLKTKEYTQEDVSNPGDLNRRAAIKVGDNYKSTYARLLIRRR